MRAVASQNLSLRDFACRHFPKCEQVKRVALNALPDKRAAARQISAIDGVCRFVLSRLVVVDFVRGFDPRAANAASAR